MRKVYDTVITDRFEYRSYKLGDKCWFVERRPSVGGRWQYFDTFDSVAAMRNAQAREL